MTASFYIQGTPKELVANGLTVNGKVVNQQIISVLVRLGVCEEVGIEQRPAGSKGPAAKVYRFFGKKAFKFAIDKQKAAALQEQAQQPTEQESKALAMPPQIPEALQKLDSNEIQAMIVGLQAIQSLMHSGGTSKH